MPNMMVQNGTKLPMYAGMPVFPGMSIGTFDGLLNPPAFLSPSPKPVDMCSPTYSQSELDMLLYGYAKSKTPGTGHALSGLCLSDLKFGKFTPHIS